MQEKVKSVFFSKLEELFGIDLRSLALFRVGMGLFILGDLISRSFDLRAFYTDSGVLPRAALLENPTFFWPISLHMLNGSVWFTVCLFFLTGLFALALTFGYRTRIATFACWLLMTSLHARNPFINQAGDTLFHLYLFWGLFLPLAATYSVDRECDASGQKFPLRILSGGSAALLLQVCIVYWFAAINKTGPFWRDGTALYFVFNIDTVAKSAAVFLLEYPGVVKFLTHFTIWLERFGPFLAFMPVATGFFRMIAIFLFLGFHLGMIFLMKLGSFPYICMLGWAVFIPSGFWDFLMKASRNRRLPSCLEKFRFREKLLFSPSRPVRIKSHWATNILALVVLAYILLINLAFTSIDKFRPAFIQKYRWVGKLFSIDQSWAMFAPDPLVENWWYVIPGKLRDGSEVDLFAGGIPPRWERPKEDSAAIPNVKWRKYFNWLPKKNYAAFRGFYGNYLCREWNARPEAGKELASLQIFYLHETVLPYFQKSETQKDLLWEQGCKADPESKPIP